MRSLWYDRTPWLRRFQIWNHLHVTSRHLQCNKAERRFADLIATCKCNKIFTAKCNSQTEWGWSNTNRLFYMITWMKNVQCIHLDGRGGEFNNSWFWKIILINRNQNVSEIDNRLLAIIASSLILLMTGLSVFRNEVGLANQYTNRSCTKQG